MPMDVILVVWFCVCTARTAEDMKPPVLSLIWSTKVLKSLLQQFLQGVVGSGMDPDLQMDIITELDLVNTTLGVAQVSGMHNASKAFLFQGKGTSFPA
ncbi:hypothetical protein H8958_014377 [Nasalis larvatus]